MVLYFPSYAQSKCYVCIYFAAHGAYSLWGYKYYPSQECRNLGMTGFKCSATVSFYFNLDNTSVCYYPNVVLGDPSRR